MTGKQSRDCWRDSVFYMTDERHIGPKQPKPAPKPLPPSWAEKFVPKPELRYIAPTPKPEDEPAP